MAKKHIARCVGRRHIELSKLPDGKVLMELKWREATTLCGLVFEPAEAQKLKVAMKTIMDPNYNG